MRSELIHYDLEGQTESLCRSDRHTSNIGKYPLWNDKLLVCCPMQSLGLEPENVSNPNNPIALDGTHELRD
jgi:hypothetical protein